MLTLPKTTTHLILLLFLVATVSNSQASGIQNKQDSLLSLIRATHSEKARAKHTFNLAKTYISSSPDSAIYTLNSVISYAENAKDSQLKASSYWLMGYLYFAKGDFGKSIKYYLATEKIYKLLDEKDKQQILLDNMSDLAIQNGCNLIATDYAERRLELIDNFDDYKLKAEILYDLGIIYNRSKDYLNANRILMRANVMYTSQNGGNDFKAYADILDELGIAQIGLYNKTNFQSYLDSALYFFDRSLKLDPSDINTAKAVHNQARVYLLQNQIEKAYNKFHEALVLKRKINSSRLLVSTYNNLGIVHYRKNSLDSAKYYFTLSINSNVKPKSVSENLRDDQLKIVFHLTDEIESSLAYLDSLNCNNPCVLSVDDIALKDYRTKQLANDKIAASIIKDDIQKEDRLAIQKEKERLKYADQEKFIWLIILLTAFSLYCGYVAVCNIRRRIIWKKAQKRVQERVSSALKLLQ